MPTGTASQIIDIIAPELAAAAGKADHITLATARTSVCTFGRNTQLAIALRAAHTLTLAARNGGDSGVVTSKKEGGLSVSYASPESGIDPDLGQTHYGRQLIGLMSGSVPFVGVTGGYLDGECTS
jgi:hypothetical protein